MAVRIGTKNPSPGQHDLLQQAGTGFPPSVGRALRQISAHDDILSGRESLHPKWLEIYKAARATLHEVLPGEVADRIAKFFDGIAGHDPGVAEIDPRKASISFLLGAGASKPDPSGIPTVQELLPDLLMRARRLDREEVNNLADYCENTMITNIEDLLTAAHIAGFCGRNPAILRLYDFLIYSGEEQEPPHRRRRRGFVDVASVAFLQDTLQVLFGLLSSRMLPAEPNSGHRAIAAYVGAHESAVVTTNYDCCVDRALTESGAAFSYKIEFANEQPVVGAGRTTPLIKLHGSLNWFYCDTCQEVHSINIEQTVRDYVADRQPYPVIAVCRGCGGQRRGLLIPPLALKFDMAPPLNPLLGEAERAFEGSDVVAVVGFSFAEADRYISRMLSKAMQSSTKRRLVIFDPDPTVAERVRRQFGARIPKFNTDRVLAVRGDCAVDLPQFLEGKFYGGAAPS